MDFNSSVPNTPGKVPDRDIVELILDAMIQKAPTSRVKKEAQILKAQRTVLSLTGKLTDCAIRVPISEEALTDMLEYLCAVAAGLETYAKQHNIPTKEEA